MIKGLHHIGVATPDLDRLCAFYVDHFQGCVLADFSWGPDNTDLSWRLGLERSSGRLAMLGFETSRLELFEFSEPITDPVPPRSVAKAGFSHIAFEVDDIAYEFARLKGVMSFHAPPLTMPSGGIFAYGRDPDGNVVELLQPPQ